MNSTKDKRQPAKEVSGPDRETVREQLYSIADWLRKAYNMTVPEIRRFLHEMLDVSV